LVRTHYRSPLNYSDQHLSDAKNALSRLYTALKETAPDEQTLDWDEPHAVRVRTAMNDDFNTPMVVSIWFELAAEVNRTHDPALARQLKGLANLLGFLNREPRVFLQAGADETGLTVEQIDTLIAARQAAKAAKNYAEADRLRAELTSAGIVLEDSPQGTTWRRA
jgi:cysteinyl-tRNA synthetase